VVLAFNKKVDDCPIEQEERDALKGHFATLKDLHCNECGWMGHTSNACWIFAQMKDRSVSKKVQVAW
jgi:hypothetical protein